MQLSGVRNNIFLTFLFSTSSAARRLLTGCYLPTYLATDLLSRLKKLLDKRVKLLQTRFDLRILRQFLLAPFRGQ